MKSLSVHVGMGTAISVLSNQMQGALLSYLLKILNTKFINALMTQMATFLLLDITAYNNRFTLISIYTVKGVTCSGYEKITSLSAF